MPKHRQKPGRPRNRATGHQVVRDISELTGPTGDVTAHDIEELRHTIHSTREASMPDICEHCPPLCPACSGTGVERGLYAGEDTPDCSVCKGTGVSNG